MIALYLNLLNVSMMEYCETFSGIDVFIIWDERRFFP